MNTTLKLARKWTLILVAMCFYSYYAAAQWSVPVSISPNAGNPQMNENMGPCIAVSGDTVHVIWSDKTSNGSAIYYTRSVDTGHTWSVAVAITDTNGKAYMPSIAASGSNVHVVWWDSIREVTQFVAMGNSSMYKHSLDGGNTWSGAKIIDSNTIFWPGVAVSGTTVLVSLDKGLNDSTIVFLTKSTDNGATFGPIQQISTRTGNGRAEDQGTATDGHYIHICWNDERPPSTSSRILKTFYRRSQDMGQTWDPEIDITDTTAYSPMVFIDSDKVDVVNGYKSNANNGFLNDWMAQSADSGGSFAPIAQVTNYSTPGSGEAYPFMACDGQNLYLVSHSFGSGAWQVFYTQSSDAGATWSQQISLGNCSATAFIALTCPVLHVVWPDSGKILYTRNPTADTKCISVDTTTGTSNIGISDLAVSVYPSPANGKFTVSYDPKMTSTTFTLADMMGRSVWSGILNDASGKATINTQGLGSGIYIWEAKAGSLVYGKGKITLMDK